MNTERRAYFRKAANFVGFVIDDTNGGVLTALNISVNGMAASVDALDPSRCNTVLNLRVPALNIMATAWIAWLEPADESSANVGLKFLRLSPMPNGYLPVVPSNQVDFDAAFRLLSLPTKPAGKGGSGARKDRMAAISERPLDEGDRTDRRVVYMRPATSRARFDD